MEIEVYCIGTIGTVAIHLANKALKKPIKNKGIKPGGVI